MAPPMRPILLAFVLLLPGCPEDSPPPSYAPVPTCPELSACDRTDHWNGGRDAACAAAVAAVAAKCIERRCPRSTPEATP